jgi:hypothetical protein
MSYFPCFHLLFSEEIFREENEEDQNQRSDANHDRARDVHIRWNLLRINKSLWRSSVIDLLHHLEGLLGLLLALKEDTHRRNGFILLECIDEQSLPLRLERVNEVHINQTIPMCYVGRRDLKAVSPDISKSRHIGTKNGLYQATRAYCVSIFQAVPLMVSHVKQTLAKKRASMSLSSARIRIALAIVEAF